MNVETHLLNRLRAAEAEYAVQALKSPGNKTEYDFGYRCGYMAGLEGALGILLGLLEDNRRDGEDL